MGRSRIIRAMHAFVRGGTIMLLLGDFLVFVLSLVFTLLVRYQEIPSKEIVRQHLDAFLPIFVLWVLIFLIAGLYDRHVSLGRRRIPVVVMRVQFINVLLAAVFFLTFSSGITPKTNLAIYLVLSTALIVGWRLYVFPLLTTRKTIKAIVVGTSEEVKAIAGELATNPYFKHFEVFVQSQEDAYSFEEFRNSMLALVQDESIEIIIADTKDESVSRLVNDFYSLVFESENIRFFNLPGIYEQLFHRIPPSVIEETWLLEHITTESPHYAYDFIKRLIDVIGALVLLVPALLLFPFIVFAIKLDDRGTIFYRAERVGRDNYPITIFKFRTMTGADVGEEALKSTLTVTRVGSFLRRTRLDELPQLLNVLRGDLSFIGPRPEMPSIAHVYAENIPYYNTRHLIKPGLSGWAQINNFDVPRGGIDIARTIDKLSFDLYYLKRRSLLLDLEIALKTVNTLLMRTGT